MGEMTAAEMEAKAVTKCRYMTARDMMSTTATLGFRISGTAGCPPSVNITAMDKCTSSGSIQQAQQIFDAFAQSSASMLEAHIVAERLHRQLLRLREAIDASEFAWQPN